MKEITVLFLMAGLLWTHSAYSQMQINKPLQLTGSGSDAKISGIQDVSSNDHAANKIYVDTAIANRAGGGLSGEYAEGLSSWQPNAINIWQDVTLATPTVSQAGTYLISALFESEHISADGSQSYRLNVNGNLSEEVQKPFGYQASTYKHFTITFMAALSPGNLVKLQNMASNNSSQKTRNLRISLIKVQ